MAWGDEQPLLNVRAIAHHLKREPSFPPIIECGPKTVNMWMKAILPDVAPAQILRRDGEVLNLLRGSSQPPITDEQSLAHHAAHGGQNLIAPILHLPVPASLFNPGLQYNHGRAQGQTAEGDDPTDLSPARQLQIDCDAAEPRRLQLEEHHKDEKTKAKEERKQEKAEGKKAKEERKQARADRKKARGERKAEETRAREERKRAKKQKRETPSKEAEKDMPTEEEIPAKKVTFQMSAKERGALFNEIGSPPPLTPPPAQSPAWEGFSDSEDDDRFPLEGPLAYIPSTRPASPPKRKAPAVWEESPPFPRNLFVHGR
jgi:hypothetical protein